MKNDILFPIRRLHGCIHERHDFKKKKKQLKKYYLNEFNEFFKQNQFGVILAMTPEHGNLGDHAIAYAEMKLLESLQIACLEISATELENLQKYNLLHLMNGHPILITGGGNLGTLWIVYEHLIRDIVSKNPHSKIMILPNSVYYEDSECGKSELEKSILTYNGHPNLTIYAREFLSYEIMKPIYNSVRLIPDMVLYLERMVSDKDRHGCLMCMRDDRERTITKEEVLLLNSKLKNIFGNDISYIDTHVINDIARENRENALLKKLLEFASASLVITDRLHGMIFCAITGTPCIVINSKSPKVKGCYEWIKDLGYIHFVDNINEIEKACASIPKCRHQYSNDHLLPYFNELKQDISNIVKGK